MIFRNLALVLFVFTIAFNAEAQQTAVEKAFIKKLIEQEYFSPKDIRELNLSNIPYSVSLGEKDDPYTVYFSIIAHEDLNGNGVGDYIVFRNSEGMLGGNVNSNQEYFYFIMRNETEIDKKYEILGYAPFSYNIIDSVSYKNNRLTAEVTQNFRTYMAEDLQSTTAHFLYKDNNLYEESYLTDCEMAKMKDKTIFKTDLLNIKRTLNIDMHNFTEVASEEYICSDTIIEASLSGCDNLSLGFQIKTKVPKTKVPSQAQFYTKNLPAIFDMLIGCSRYKTVLGKVAADCKGKPHNPNEAITGYVDKTWNYIISRFNYDESSNTLYFSISVENITNPNQEENWEVMTRRK